MCIYIRTNTYIIIIYNSIAIIRNLKWIMRLRIRRGRAARRSLRLTMDMAWEARNRRPRTVRARIRPLHFRSKSRCLSTAYLPSYLQRRPVWASYRSRFNGWELEWEGIARNPLSHLVTRVQPGFDAHVKGVHYKSSTGRSQNDPWPQQRSN